MVPIIILYLYEFNDQCTSKLEDLALIDPIGPAPQHPDGSKTLVHT